MYTPNKQSGFLKIIIVIIIAIAIIAYFKIDIRGLVETYVDKDGLLEIWNSIKGFFLKIWEFMVDFWQEHIQPWIESQRNS
jgi:hypothetical protein